MAPKASAPYVLSKTDRDVWTRGEAYTDAKVIQVVRSADEEIEAVVRGTSDYTVRLKFSGGGLSRRCTCPHAGRSTSGRVVCKHMVAVAILWDERRGISRPTPQTIATLTIPPPPVSRAELTAIFRDPLHADLAFVRLAQEARETWSRPHSQLPRMPRFETNPTTPLTLKEVRQAFQEMARWANRRTYDPYFCAGEMIAAFCEMLRTIGKRLDVTAPLEGTAILREAQRFHYRLVLALIDDSDGYHVLNEAHLEMLYTVLRRLRPASPIAEACEEHLRAFEAHRNDY